MPKKNEKEYLVERHRQNAIGRNETLHDYSRVSKCGHVSIIGRYWKCEACMPHWHTEEDEDLMTYPVRN